VLYIASFLGFRLEFGGELLRIHGVNLVQNVDRWAFYPEIVREVFFSFGAGLGV
jgi:hypothetical protein